RRRSGHDSTLNRGSPARAAAALVRFSITTTHKERAGMHLATCDWCKIGILVAVVVVVVGLQYTSGGEWKWRSTRQAKHSTTITDWNVERHAKNAGWLVMPHGAHAELGCSVP